MLIPSILFLALACRAGAVEPAQITLRKISELPIPNGITSGDFTLIASIALSPSNVPWQQSRPADSDSVGVWRLSDGRQVHRIALPHVNTSAGDQGYGFVLSGFSPGNRFLLMNLQNYRDLKQADAAVYLLDLENETARQIYSTRRGCDHLPAALICPSTRAEFSPDGNKILIRVENELGQSTPQGETKRYAYESLVVDRGGKTLEDVKETYRQDPPLKNGNSPDMVAENPTGGRISGFGADGHLLGVIRDAASCELRDLSAGKRLAFLDDCSQKDELSFLAPGILVSAVWGTYKSGRSAKRWDVSTGKIVSSMSCAGCLVKFSENGDYAFIGQTDPPFRFEIRSRPFETVLFSTVTNNVGAVYGFDVSPDGGLLLQPIAGGRSAVYQTGLASKPVQVPQVAEMTIDVDSIPRGAAKVDPDAYAIVIGIEKYQQDGIPPVDYAAHDAQTMYSYLTGAMGFDAKNIVLLTDAQATKTSLEKNLKWLSNRVTAKSRVFVYYAGHGSPNPETGQGYLMPYEADPSYLDETAFPIAKLYASLGKLPTQDVTVVLDACFSGQGGRSLIAKGTRPLVSVVQSKAEPNTVVLAAAGSNQVSASFPEARHGLLTYYLLAGLQGEADAKHDGKITADELIAYVRPAVERAAKLQNVEQTPSLMSPTDAVSRPWIVLAPK